MREDEYIYRTKNI